MKELTLTEQIIWSTGNFVVEHILAPLLACLALLKRSEPGLASASRCAWQL